MLEPDTYLDAARCDRGVLLLTRGDSDPGRQARPGRGDPGRGARFLPSFRSRCSGLVRTTRGVLALAPDGTVRWWRELKPARFRHKDKSLDLEKAFEKAVPFVNGRERRSTRRTPGGDGLDRLDRPDLLRKRRDGSITQPRPIRDSSLSTSGAEPWSAASRCPSRCRSTPSARVPVPLGPTPDGDRAVKWRRTLRVGRRVER